MIVTLAIVAALTVRPPAETEIGSKSEPREVQQMHQFGLCAVAERPSQVRAVLDMDFRDRRYGKAMQRLLDEPVECRGQTLKPGHMRAGMLLYGGAFAEGLLRRERMLKGLGEATAYKPELPAIEARNGGELLAFCVVRAKPDQVVALLETEPATVQEYQAIAAMAPTLSACVPANSKSEFTREALRALLALGSYRLAMHNAAPAVGARTEAVK